MTLKRRQVKKFPNFDLGVSYKVNEAGLKLRDAVNAFSVQGRLETRYGRSRFNDTSLGGPVLSLSFFQHADGAKYRIAKVGGTLFAVSSTGAHTTLKTGLSSTTKHRGITWARGSTSRHIIAIEGDGLFQFNGTTFSELGQNGPAAPTVNTAAGTLTAGTYLVYLTFYSSQTGFETNAGPASSPITVSGSQGIGLSVIPTTASNATIDKVRIYLKNNASADDAVYAGEVSLGTTTFEIDDNPVSTESYPVSNAKPLAGGGKFLTEFNRKLVYAGNGTFRNDVFISEEDLPDAFNDGTGPDRNILSPIYDGSISGIARGLFNNTVLQPYLAIFKERSIHIYSEIGGVENATLVPISSEIGCVSHDTISVKNGNIHFLSSTGWMTIVDGRLQMNRLQNPDGSITEKVKTLGDDDISDVFTSPGYAYEINKSRLSDAFSVYYPTLDQYMTWVAEGGANEFSKTYVYEFKVGGFKPYQFFSPSTCACIGVDANGKEVIYMADADGFLYSHSTQEPRSDHDKNGVEQIIPAFAMLTWLDGDDFNSSYKWRDLIIKRVGGTGNLEARAFVNYSLDQIAETYLFETETSGFVLDVSKLDEDELKEGGRMLETSKIDINKCGENLLIGFYQNALGSNLALASAQIEFNRNGNRN
jgi:hypothetical protein